jgi:uncharacterized protein (DUF342 family)
MKKKKKSTQGRDGRFSIRYAAGFALLTVYPPIAPGRPVYPEEVESRMKILDVPFVPMERLKKIIKEAAGEPVSLIEWPAGAGLSAGITVFISDDRMSASVNISPPRKGGGEVTVAMVHDKLADAGVVEGIDEHAVIHLLETGDYNNEVVVANGTEARPSRKATVQYMFNTNPGKPYLVRDYGKIDLRELDFVQSVTSGDVLAVKTPAFSGVIGMTVTGEKIEINDPGAEVVMRAGNNVTVSEDGLSLIAACDGHVTLRSGIVSVDTVLLLQNVDYSTGNINAPGSVIISGTIADGFTVKAAGSIEVTECVGRVNLEAGGDIILKAGINANQDGELTAGGDIFARFIEGASARVRGSVYVSEMILHSTLEVDQNCILRGGHGELIGGRLVVGGSLWCTKLGNRNNLETIVIIGVSPGAMDEYNTLLVQVKEKSALLEQLKQIYRRLEKVHKSGEITEADQFEYDSVTSQIEIETSILNELETLTHTRRGELVPLESSRVICEETAFYGTVILFGVHAYRIGDGDSHKTILHWDGESVHESGFNPNDPPEIETD